MKSIELKDVNALAPLIGPGNTEPVLVTSHGQTVAAVVPLTGEDAEDLLLSRSPQFEAMLQRSQQRLDQEGGQSTEEVRRRLGL
ncbi:MAG: hypothetical protein HY000_32855 [Planctomycetes bacterium]|nr:hypothetical protein [Planctomycetota bacterium]